MNRRITSLSAALAGTTAIIAAVIGAPALAATPATAPAATPATAPSSATPTASMADTAGDSRGAVTRSKTVTREFVEGGTPRTVDSTKVTVKVNKTRELRGRERLSVSWSGAKPSAGRAANPYGATGLAQEYPVVLMQCRGVDSPTGKAEKLSPETCWTSTWMQRSTSTVTTRQAVWRHDLYATQEQRDSNYSIGTKTKQTPPLSHKDDSGQDVACPSGDIFSVQVNPFVTAKGTTFTACDTYTMPPEAAVDSAYPPAEQYAFTSEDGKGETQFEVRTDVENESLGCNAETACSLVVIPIMGISCADDSTECRKEGRFLPGESNFANEGVDKAVSGELWWSPSNWRNRISIPLSFGLPPDVCDVLDTRPPTAFYGSELMSQASVQWTPAYCLDEKRFNFQHNRMSDAAAFRLVTNGDGAAAFLARARDAADSPEPLAYAPTALTGFAIGYAIDRPKNAGEFQRLRLNARLIAKLMTQSYPASNLGQQRAGLQKNPVSINLDPEFKALNPGLDTISRESAATLMSLSESSDTLSTLTEYLAADPEARAFIAGTPDPWGMVVNPSYKGMALPVSEWPLLDSFVPETTQECLLANPSPYLSNVAAPVTSLRKIAEAVLDGWPLVSTKCDRSSTADPWKLGRVDRQGVGTRFVLGLVTLGDLKRFGLQAAELQTSSTASTTAKFTSARGRTFVGPTNAGMLSAVALGTQDGTYGPFPWTQSALLKKRTAYPGTQVVYTVAKMQGLEQADADKVAQFIKVSTTEGQQPGPGNGELADGYVPLRRTGATAELWSAAQRSAAAIAAQQGGAAGGTPPAGTSTAGATGTGSSTASGGTGSAGAGAATAPTSSGVSSTAAPAAGGPATGAKTLAAATLPGKTQAAGPVETAPTARVNSWLGRFFVPMLLVVGPAAALLAGGGQLMRRFGGVR